VFWDFQAVPLADNRVGYSAAQEQGWWGGNAVNGGNRDQPRETKGPRRYRELLKRTDRRGQGAPKRYASTRRGFIKEVDPTTFGQLNTKGTIGAAEGKGWGRTIAGRQLLAENLVKTEHPRNAQRGRGNPEGEGDAQLVQRRVGKKDIILLKKADSRRGKLDIYTSAKETRLFPQKTERCMGLQSE